ncbi:MAG: BamA/TamA family outer membrane protein [Vicinamibacteraceae bacterium]|nr:BamA/TamA family outer membrane protein [Vicinamibacteraceae bacterium]
MRRAVALLAVAVVLVLGAAAPARAQLDDYIGQPIAAVRVYEAGQLVTAGQVVDLVETRAGFPLSLDRVRESILQLVALGRYEDVRVEAERGELGLTIVYRLERIRVASRLAFEGRKALDEDLLRDAVAAPLGRPPRLARAAQAESALRALYARHGFEAASIASAPRVGPDGEATLEFRIDAGERRAIAHLDVEGAVPFGEARLLSLLKLSTGGRWNPAEAEARTERALREFREQGYYEATLRTTAVPASAGQGVAVTVAVDAGPKTTLVFEGDPLPRSRLDAFVPLEREGAADEDLLEDSKLRIERYLQAGGFWRAQVDYRRELDDPGSQRIVFTVRQGRRAVTGAMAVSGNTAIPTAELLGSLTLETGEPFVQATLDADLARLSNLYAQRGYANARLDAVLATREPAEAGAPVVVEPRLRVQEGPRTLVGDVAFQGLDSVDEATLRARLRAASGAAFYAPLVVQDRSAVLRALVSRGHVNARVEVTPAFSADQTRVDLRYTVDEGPRVLVDRIIIVGNRRTSTRTILRELQVESGAPLDPDALTESQRRLAALGLFRRVRVEDVSSPGETSRDVVVTVEEAPPTSIGYGAGLEVGRRLRQEGDEGTAVERTEFAPRGFFEIGRRNLFGKNRSINLFVRGSLRERDPTGEVSNRVGLNEYRVLTVFREPRLFGTTADAEFTAFAEQAVRSSFNFSRNGVTALVSRRMSRQWTLAGRYTLGSTKIFDARYNPDEQPLIDRLFPQVRLSVVSSTSFWDTRDDVLDPTRGALVGVETDVAVSGLGSEVGFVKTLVQGFAYRRLPGTSRVVVAAGARLGLATGFDRTVSRDLPASERFYAGGDTTVRGYALDRLGDGPTIDRNGFPTGGNGLVILNGELRFPVWRSVGGVAFVDAGNVFLRASDIELTRIRTAVGAGLRYKSPVGPIRFDIGFKLDPQTFADGTRERRYALHISIGQAF